MPEDAVFDNRKRDDDMKNEEISERIEKISDLLTPDGRFGKGKLHLPSPKLIASVIGKLQYMLFPSVYYEVYQGQYSVRCNLAKTATEVFDLLSEQIARSFECDEESAAADSLERARTISLELLESLPKIRETLLCDVESVMNHDPAARSETEVLLAYPGFEAITVYRISHFLFKKDVPLVPRLMSEFIHRKTGIDIHPGAEIAPYCSIDHGTGLIIGETTIIGSHVALYHNVTLGARAVSRDYVNKKRHPTLQDRVIVYPGATILGDIEVGSDSIIGGNVFLLESCPPGSKIYAKPPETIVKKT